MEDFLTLKELKAWLKLSRSTIYLSMSKGAFPQPVKMGRLSRWRKVEIDEWLAERIERRDEKDTASM